MPDVALPAAAPASWFARWRERALRTTPRDVAPVVLRHSRIYLLPTRRGWAVIGTLAMMLVGSLNYSLALGLGVTFVLAGLVAAAQLHAFRNLAGLQVAPLAAGEAFAGGTLPFTLAVHAGAAARHDITLASAGAAATGSVAAGTALTFTLAVPAPTRGRLALGRVTLSSGFPLGLWRAWAYVHFPLAGLVFPAAEMNPPPLPAGRAGHDSLVHGAGDEADLAGLREYQRGDPPQRVAWKAVARGAGWFSKEFDAAGGGGAVTLAWAALPAALPVEARLARLTAWTLAAERAARPFALAIPGSVLPVGQGREQRTAALTALALYPAAPASRDAIDAAPRAVPPRGLR